MCQQLHALVLVEDFGDGGISHGVHDDLSLSPELGPSVSRVVAKVPTGRRRESTHADVDARRPAIAGANGAGHADGQGGVELVSALGKQDDGLEGAGVAGDRHVRGIGNRGFVREQLANLGKRDGGKRFDRCVAARSHASTTESSAARAVVQWSKGLSAGRSGDDDRDLVTERAAHPVLEGRRPGMWMSAVVEQDVDTAPGVERASAAIAQRVARKRRHTTLVAAGDLVPCRSQVGDRPVGGVAVGFDDEYAHVSSSDARTLAVGDLSAGDLRR